jgi:L-ascorbate metabolism protein UlaG (beta-lactamase superfamily)
MSVNVTWYSHACLLIETEGTKLLVDPFITGNPLAPVAADEIDADYILVSHGHGDHVGDTVDIAKRTGATVISNFEIHNWMTAQGVENGHPQHIGGGFDYPLPTMAAPCRTAHTAVIPAVFFFISRTKKSTMPATPACFMT